MVRVMQVYTGTQRNIQGRRRVMVRIIQGHRGGHGEGHAGSYRVTE